MTIGQWVRAWALASVLIWREVWVPSMTKAAMTNIWAESMLRAWDIGMPPGCCLMKMEMTSTMRSTIHKARGSTWQAASSMTTMEMTPIIAVTVPDKAPGTIGALVFSSMRGAMMPIPSKVAAVWGSQTPWESLLIEPATTAMRGVMSKITDMRILADPPEVSGSFWMAPVRIFMPQMLWRMVRLGKKAAMAWGAI